VPQGDRNADALRALVQGGAVIRARMRQQQDGNAPLIDMAAPVLAYAARDGRMIVADSETGVVRWSAAAEIAQATHLTVTPGHVVIAGMDEHNAPLLCVYDVHTGQLQQRIPEPQRNHVQWIGATPEGLLIYVTTTQVVAYDLATGQPRWIRKPGVQLQGPEAWMAGGQLFVRSRGGDLLMVDLGDDQTVRAVITGEAGPPLGIYEADGRFVIVTARSVIAVDEQGESLWRDSISDPTQFVACTMSQAHLILLNRLDPVEDQPQRRSYRVYFLELKSGVIGFDREIIGPPQIDRTAVLDRRLVVGSDSFTAVLSDAN
jgi:outer membrane protein assembly factor BamB